MQNSLTPTVGRLVLYKYGAFQVPALVVGVNMGGTVNLHVFPNEQRESFFTSSIVQGEADGQWDWMPFQKDQQARYAGAPMESAFMGGGGGIVSNSPGAAS